MSSSMPGLFRNQVLSVPDELPRGALTMPYPFLHANQMKWYGSLSGAFPQAYQVSATARNGMDGERGFLPSGEGHPSRTSSGFQMSRFGVL